MIATTHLARPFCCVANGSLTGDVGITRVHPKIVQERLGHSTISITLDIYSHGNPAMDADAANTVAALIPRPLSGRTWPRWTVLVHACPVQFAEFR